MTTNLFVIANVQQLRTGGSFRILLPFFRTSWGVGVLNSAIFNSFHNRVEFRTILEGLRNFRGGGLTPKPPCPRYAIGLAPTRNGTTIPRPFNRGLVTIPNAVSRLPGRSRFTRQKEKINIKIRHVTYLIS